MHFMIKRCISSALALRVPWSFGLWCSILQDKWRLIHVTHAISFSFPSLSSTLDLKVSSILMLKGKGLSEAIGGITLWVGGVLPHYVPPWWAVPEGSSARLSSSSLIPTGGFVYSAWAVGGVVFMELVLSHVWPWLSDPKQDLCGTSSWKQGLWRARGADQTLQYSCLPWLVLILHFLICQYTHSSVP